MHLRNTLSERFPNNLRATLHLPADQIFPCIIQLDSHNKITTEWKETVKTLGLDIKINEPTRFSPYRNSCIDNILTNANHCHVSGVLNVNLSDHEVVFTIHKKAKA